MGVQEAGEQLGVGAINQPEGLRQRRWLCALGGAGKISIPFLCPLF